MFSTETASPGCFRNESPSAGHCAVVAIVVNMIYGGELVSATVQGQSHWYNRIAGCEVDLTADQFGFDQIKFKDGEDLYEGARVRTLSEVKAETFIRVHIFLRKMIENGVLKII
jgi:hypothetical protein